jgi:hypothetical protein
MKKIAFVTCALVLMALGCTSNDKNGAGREATPAETAAPAPPTAATASVSPASTEAPGRSDPSANGGSSLTASTPYNGNGQTVSQNINPAPFLTASQRGTSTTAVPPNSLTSRADGTMSGPNDQPAAGTVRAGSAQANDSQEQTTSRPARKGKKR